MSSPLTPLLFVSPLFLSPPVPPFLCQVCEWNSVFILTSSNKIYHLVEKDTQSKVRGACTAIDYITFSVKRIICVQLYTHAKIEIWRSSKTRSN